MAVRDYDPGAVTLTWDGLLITGFAEGSFITWEADADTFSKVTGSQGDVTRVRSRNRSSRVTFRLQQTSPINDVLSQRHIEDRAGLPRKGSLLLKDELGTTSIAAENAWIVRAPSVEFSDADAGREWMLDLGETVPLVGGSVT